MPHAIAQNEDERHNSGHSRGKIFLVGTGPGDPTQMTFLARETISKSTVILGYKRYVDLIAPLITSQKIVTSGMTEEVSRCKQALAMARNGEVVSVVSSGDPGIYGMAGLVLELDRDGEADVEVIPGVSAVNAAASLIGAPLMNDFVVISLSDCLTPWKVIEKRLKCAAEGDFVTAIYNPRSKKRVDHIVRAKEIIRGYRSGETPVAIVTNAYREKQSVVFSDLDSFTDKDIGMLSIVIIGNSMTKLRGNRLITERGYRDKYGDCF